MAILILVPPKIKLTPPGDYLVPQIFAPLRTSSNHTAPIQPWSSGYYFSNDNTIGHHISCLRPSPTTILSADAACHVKNRRFNVLLLILCRPIAIINNNKYSTMLLDKELPPPMIIICHRYRCRRT